MFHLILGERTIHKYMQSDKVANKLALASIYSLWLGADSCIFRGTNSLNRK